MANLKAECHKHLTRRSFKYDEEMSFSLLESDLKMSKFHANVVSFDGKGSYLSTLMSNFYEQNSYWTDRTNIGTFI